MTNRQIRDEEQDVELNSDEMEENHYDQIKKVVDEGWTEKTDNEIVLDIEEVPCTEEEKIDLEEPSLLVVAQTTLNHSGNLTADYNEQITSLAQTPAPIVKSSVLEYGHQKEGEKSYGDNQEESEVESTDQDWKPLTNFGKALLIVLGPLNVIKKVDLARKELKSVIQFCSIKAHSGQYCFH